MALPTHWLSGLPSTAIYPRATYPRAQRDQVGVFARSRNLRLLPPPLRQLLCCIVTKLGLHGPANQAQKLTEGEAPTLQLTDDSAWR